MSIHNKDTKNVQISFLDISDSKTPGDIQKYPKMHKLSDLSKVNNPGLGPNVKINFVTYYRFYLITYLRI